MICSVCQQFPRDKDENAFVKGTTYLKIDGIQAHEVSESHIQANSRDSALKTPVHRSAACKTLTALKRQTMTNS
ncbi:hypothetical protein DPMN_089670 [Dreissena polymorpha]|uniref:C17orf113 probable zinc finger domain-containing protein n=1 Tax=Dreissena polymorpha TaxID=45954 RepID=A0A9D4QZ42_DREPO|nr:hypothetical protein DPMN_089670 [Dreissena polymorpha]